MAPPEDERRGSSWPSGTDVLSVDQFLRAGNLASADSTISAAERYKKGLALRAEGQPGPAFRTLAMAGLDPAGPAEAALEAGTMLALAKKTDEAIGWITLAMRRSPRNPAMPCALGALLARRGQDKEALRLFSQALMLDPKHVETIRYLALFHLGRAQLAEAAAYLQRWHEQAPDDPDPLTRWSDLLFEQRRYREALDQARRAVRLASNGRTHLRIARALTMLDRHAEAIAEFSIALDLEPDLLPARLHYAHCLLSLGRFVDARAQLERLLAADPANSAALLALSETHRFTRDDPWRKTMEDLIEHPRSAGDAINLRFALGKACDDAGDFEMAAHHFRLGNAFRRSQAAYDEPAMLSEVRRMAEIFTGSNMERLSGAGVSSQQPIFIIGMPRSGSTLVEQILVSHPDVAAGGETNYTLQAMKAALARAPRQNADYLSSLTRTDISMLGEEYLACISPTITNHTRVTDKQWANFLLTGLIHLILPKAKIIHTVRDPFDTCLSLYTKAFDQRFAFACDLKWLGRFYSAQAALMRHWHDILPAGVMIELRYEDVVADLETAARRITAHCGLTWDDRCLRFYECERPVHTASAAQVRRPIYTTSLARKKHYASQFNELVSALNDRSVEAFFDARER